MRTSGKQQQQVIDESNQNKYFHMMLNMADDDLGVYEYRLLGHYIRICGIHGEGACWESTRTTAKNCKMSVGKVSKTRQELQNKGYVTLITPEKHDKDTLMVKVIDRWLDNMQRYSPNEQEPKGQPERSPHEQECSLSERKRSPHETIKNSLRRTNEELKDSAPVPNAVVAEEIPKASTSPDEPQDIEPTLEDMSEQDPEELIEPEFEDRSPQEPEPVPAIPEKEKPAAKLDKALRDEWYDAVKEVFGESAGLNGKYQKLLRGEFTEKSEKGKLEGEWFEYQLPADSGLTPDLLREWGRQHKRDNPDQVMIKQPIKIQSKLLTFLEAQKKPVEPTYLAPYHKPHVVEDIKISEEQRLEALKIMTENDPYKKASGL